MEAPPSHMDGEEEQEKEMKIAVNKVKNEEGGFSFFLQTKLCIKKKKELGKLVEK